MTLDRWLSWAQSDTRDRKIDGLAPLLESLGPSIDALRKADWNPTPDESQPVSPESGDAQAEVPAATAHAHPAPQPNERHVDTPTGSGPEFLPLAELAGLLAHGEYDAREVVERCLANITRLNPTLNAIITALPDVARADAAAADARRRDGEPLGPLHGVPFTVKDLIDQAGLPTSAASHVRHGHRAQRDAIVVERLRRAGGIIVGKTNLHEFAMGPTSEDSAFGPPLHPLEPSRSPGGSSGGSAAAIVSGMCSASIGTDTGGSIRIPASACGLVGLKPTFGDIPLDGVVPLAWSLDHLGPLARTVEDAWRIYDALSDDNTAALPRPAERLDRLRLVVLEPYFCDLLEDGVRHAFGRALDALRAAGVRVTIGALPHAPYIGTVYAQTVLAEALAYHESTLDRRPEDYTAPVRLRLEMARYIPAADYVRAQRGRQVLCTELDALLEDADALVLPTLPVAASRRGASTVTLNGRNEPVRNALLRLTQVFNLTAHPAITIPVGEAEPRLRAGFQIATRRHETRKLLAIAKACEGEFLLSSMGSSARGRSGH